MYNNNTIINKKKKARVIYFALTSNYFSNLAEISTIKSINQLNNSRYSKLLTKVHKKYTHKKRYSVPI